MPFRILVDVTRTHASGLHTGIQRVVRGLLAGLEACAMAGDGPPVSPAVFDREHWYTLDHLPAHPHTSSLPFEQSTDVVRRPAAINENDFLLMADASWYLDPWPATDAFMARGGRLCGLVHDLLPLNRGDWFRPGLQVAFAAHLSALTRRSSLLLVPSRHVGAQLEAYLRQSNDPGTGVSPPRLLAHGSDLGLAQPSSHEPRHTARRHGDFDLMVATLEPRKNHALALDAFDQLWAQGCSRQLVLVGAAGWQVEPLLARIKHHPHNGQRLHWYADLSDAALVTLYRHARALLYLSRDEGFGLPLLEARQLGCPVIAADIPVLREVGQDWPTYVDLTQPARLHTALQTLPHAPRAPAGTHARPWRTWETVARELIAHLQTCRAAAAIGLDS